MNQKPPPPPYGYGGGPSSSSPSNTTIGTLSARAKQTTQSVIATLRPWRMLLDLSAVSLPRKYDEAMANLRQNLSYFRANYALAVLGIVFLGLVYHPISMAAFIVVFVAWILLYFSRDGSDPIVVSGREVDDRIVLGLLSVVTVLALVYTDVGENVLVSLIVGLLMVGAHAAVRNTGDLFIDEESARQGGLVSAGSVNRGTGSYTPI
ncbi:PRA1 family protein E [Raphanus sativus]|uniref:PRA1 family protein n=1 Tax=Raphanus sativus TaxID=3726 RepID=A0A6J0JDC7_RAPSA|nr:PRA1 family protein E [Raphanus sativus]XP_056860772.1 PRA1 family protein E-like [Raphanus sativus]KAJ4915075.1 PRA1 family protein E [Raphanus sativus]KAJ4915079.1 PRA1 family protein E [Raphanus sativus]